MALNNKILTDAMSSGLLEQSKPAWNFNRLDALWNGACVRACVGLSVCLYVVRMPAYQSTRKHGTRPIHSPTLPIHE